MLVLSRKANESILIGDEVTIKVLKIKGNTVQLGIEAPREITVLRGELNPKTKSAAEVVSDIAVDPSLVVGDNHNRPLLCLLDL